MDPVHGGGPWTRGPCFVLSRFQLGLLVIETNFFLSYVMERNIRNEKSNIKKNNSIAKSEAPGHFDIFDMLFPISGILSISTIKIFKVVL